MDLFALSCNTQKVVSELHQYSQQPTNLLSKVQDLFAFLSVLIFHYEHIFRVWIQKLFQFIFLSSVVVFINLSFISFISCLYTSLNFVFKIFFYFLFQICKTLHGKKAIFNKKLFKEVPLHSSFPPIFTSPP